MTAYTADNLVTGTTYSFKIRARNEIGYSFDSNEITIIAAAKPSKPFSPQTSFANDVVRVYWDEPVTNGAPILSYTIKLRHSNIAIFSENLEYCDGTDATITQNRECFIPAYVFN